ncbi:hypothetical protein EX30DRAFT_226163 [Ascodesmis nigricans]|uniref:Uncharacterized protein n=1 Tax=Ascodesmis nigricans TaxID=341454 RepID=A0A4S2MNP9_9PEZI|nr:hypothetical protein EX30DRAFT_226163 [Ascodesmis nigricans]
MGELEADEDGTWGMGFRCLLGEGIRDYIQYYTPALCFVVSRVDILAQGLSALLFLSFSFSFYNLFLFHSSFLFLLPCHLHFCWISCCSCCFCFIASQLV